jgi:hypothetical protein
MFVVEEVVAVAVCDGASLPTVNMPGDVKDGTL